MSHADRLLAGQVQSLRNKARICRDFAVGYRDGPHAKAYELEAELREKGKDDKAEQIRRVAELANFVYVRQKGTPKGNARPVLNAQHLIDDDEPFFVFFADDFFRSEVPRAVQLKAAHERTGRA